MNFPPIKHADTVYLHIVYLVCFLVLNGLCCIPGGHYDDIAFLRIKSRCKFKFNVTSVTSTETVGLLGSPGRPPRLSQSSWAVKVQKMSGKTYLATTSNLDVDEHTRAEQSESTLRSRNSMFITGTDGSPLRARLCACPEISPESHSVHPLTQLSL